MMVLKGGMSNTDAEQELKVSWFPCDVISSFAKTAGILRSNHAYCIRGLSPVTRMKSSLSGLVSTTTTKRRYTKKEASFTARFECPILRLFRQCWPIASVWASRAQVTGRRKGWHGRARGKTVKVTAGQATEITQKSTGGCWSCWYYQRWFLGETALDFIWKTGKATSLDDAKAKRIERTIHEWEDLNIDLIYIILLTKRNGYLDRGTMRE